mmetsp:Transcript_8962/g.21853  ORF Transcript_8962/g.21853 Transcript_8962/m.21853 type:complete len:211 (+) Transcript_8962:1584-2216(+)
MPTPVLPEIARAEGFQKLLRFADGHDAFFAADIKIGDRVILRGFHSTVPRLHFVIVDSPPRRDARRRADIAAHGSEFEMIATLFLMQLHIAVHKNSARRAFGSTCLMLHDIIADVLRMIGISYFRFRIGINTTDLLRMTPIMNGERLVRALVEERGHAAAVLRQISTGRGFLLFSAGRKNAKMRGRGIEEESDAHHLGLGFLFPRSVLNF